MYVCSFAVKHIPLNMDARFLMFLTITYLLSRCLGPGSLAVSVVLVY